MSPLFDADPTAPDRHSPPLGPSDSSDSASDVLGAGNLDSNDEMMPVDRALDPDLLAPVDNDLQQTIAGEAAQAELDDELLDAETSAPPEDDDDDEDDGREIPVEPDDLGEPGSSPDMSPDMGPGAGTGPDQISEDERLPSTRGDEERAAADGL